MSEEMISDVSSPSSARLEICPTCGGRLDWSTSEVASDGRRYVECRKCFNKYCDGSGEWSPKVQAQLTHAMSKYRDGAFEDAVDDLEEAIEEAPNCYEAYWYNLLAKNGIIYVKDNGFKPTCNRANFNSFYDQQDYKNAVKYAPEHMQNFYKEQADVVEGIRKEFMELVEKEEPFDIFLSFKKTELDSKKLTEDAMYADRIYNDLSQKYKVFYSEKTLKAGTNFEPTIFRALSSAKVFILICSKKEYANAVWVKNEWSRYLRMMSDGLKKPETITIVYPYEFPSDLPGKLSKLQGIRYNDRNYDTQMKDFITRSFAKYPSENNIARKTFSNERQNFGPKKAIDPALQVQRKEFVGVEIDIDESSKIKRIKKYLEQYNFSGAEDICRGVLNKNEQSDAAKFYLIYATEAIANDQEYIDDYASRINCIKWFDDILQTCRDTAIFHKIIDMTKAICDKAVKDENTDFIVESFNLVAQWAPEKDVDEIRETLLNFSKSVLKKPNADNALATSIFDCVLRTYSDNEVEKYARMNYEFGRCLHDVKRFDDALTYYNKSLDLIDNSQCYFDRLLATNGLVKHTDRIKAKNVEEKDLENILKFAPTGGHGKDGKASRNEMQSRLVNFALIQAHEGVYDIATKVFDYVIQFVPQDDKERNKKYLVPFADMLLSMAQYDLAKNYYGPMINIDDLCYEAHWGMLKAEHRCKDDRALLYCEYDISVDNHYMKALYGSDEDDDINQYYTSFNEMKLMLYESVIEKSGWELLKQGDFEEAMKRFVELQNFELNTRRRKVSSHPECCWGMLLADARCRSDAELFAKRDQFPLDKIQENDYCKDYLKSYNKKKGEKNQFYYKGNFGSKKPPITQQEYLGNLLPCDVNHLRIYDTLAVAWERKTYIEQRGRENKEMLDNLNAEKARINRTAVSRVRSATSKKNVSITALVVLIVGVVALAIWGCAAFYSNGVSTNWFETLELNRTTVFGVCIIIPLIIGGIIGVIAGGLYGAIGGAIAGAIAGLAIVGIVYACCWVLVPLVALIVIAGCGFGIWALKESMSDHVRSIHSQARENAQQRENEVNNKINYFNNETSRNINALNNKITKMAQANGIDLNSIGIDSATVESIQGGKQSLTSLLSDSRQLAADLNRMLASDNNTDYDDDDDDEDDEDNAAGYSAALVQAYTNKYLNASSDNNSVVFLKLAGSNKVQVIRVIRDYTGLGLVEAKAIVDKAPTMVKGGLSETEADKFAHALNGAGATAEVL